MKDIFISHSSTDRKVAYNLVEFLEGNGVSCFIAPRDIEGGDAYASRLMKAIDDCKLVLLIASKSINESEHILNEVDVVIEKHKPILPVFIEDFQFNDDFRYYLGRKQWIVAYPDSPENYYNKIFTEIENFVIIEKKAPKVAPPVENNAPLAGTRTVFEYVPERGIMINPEDHQRNVSFRTDTLINMMGGLYESVAELADADKAHQIFFDSGYVSGKNFAERINSTWDTGYSLEEIKKKLRKWCVFDSAVGWGKFDVSIDYDDDDTATVLGKLKINEAFLVDKTKKRKICGFIKGYCTGVLQTLMDTTDVELECVECPIQSRFKCSCVFDIVLKG